ncbi:general substrate transporter [Hesseltinella vesiculosa]|uniref:General substrate transporter n=1 Tax=Hesseltinella vesiculosa TaxID=101127 RepID=A0A1X2GBG6_9FUNG|nr:general substrate transporter [Hesseltinella vesiculosa]
MADTQTASLRPFVVLCACVASLGALNNGINTSALNIPADQIRNCPAVAPGVVTFYPNSGLPECIPMSSWIWGVASGAYALGGLVGAVVSAPISKRFGRRDSMILMNVTFFIGAVLLATSTASAQFAFGRVFVGIGAGFMTATAPPYIAEIAPPNFRGALCTCFQLLITVGILLIQCIGLGLRSSWGWRVICVITVGPAILQMACLPLLPRSPRWLLSQNRVHEARAELLRLRNGDIDNEFNDMLSHFTHGATRGAASDNEKGDLDSFTGLDALAEATSQDQTLSIRQIMSIPVLAKLSIKIMIVHMACQLTGINAIMYYSTSIFQGSFGDQAVYVAIGVSVLNVVMTVIALGLIDRLGRKKLLLISSSCMCVFSVLITIGLRYDVAPLQVVCVMLFVASFAVGLGAIPFALTSEVYPTYAVSAASSMALTTNWLCNFIIGLIFPTLQSACGAYVFLIFACLTLAVFFFVLVFIPETRMKTIEEIGRMVGWADIHPATALRH